MRCGMSRSWGLLKEGRSSFSEEKEAKRLLFERGARWRPAVCPKWIKVFWFFFSKKNNSSLPVLLSALETP
jgi:hypothetical protein